MLRSLYTGKLELIVDSAALQPSSILLLLLLIFYSNHNVWCLVDNDSDVSILSLSLFNKPKFKGVGKLLAANGTEIHVAGAHMLQVDFNLHKKFSWNFIVADISTPILD